MDFNAWRAGGMPGAALRFAGLAATADGELLLSANGEGTVLRLSRAAAARKER